MAARQVHNLDLITAAQRSVSACSRARDKLTQVSGQQAERCGLRGRRRFFGGVEEGERGRRDLVGREAEVIVQRLCLQPTREADQRADSAVKLLTDIDRSRGAKAAHADLIVRVLLPRGGAAAASETAQSVLVTAGAVANLSASTETVGTPGVMMDLR